MEESNRQDALKRLRRIEGQVRGIARMVEEDRYCIDIVNQIQAAGTALDKVERAILKDHIRHCVTDAVQGTDPDAKARVLDELMDVIDREGGRR